MNALSSHNIPNFGIVVERCRHYLVALCVEVKRHNLSLVALKVEQAGTFLDIPNLGSVVHGTSGSQHAVRIEAETYDFLIMTSQSVHQLTSC